VKPEKKNGMVLAAETQASFTPTSSSARWPFGANLSEKSTNVTKKPKYSMV